MTELEKLLDDGNSFRTTEDKERASQILKAVEGMRIWEARELLERCMGALELTEIHYKEALEETTS